MRVTFILCLIAISLRLKCHLHKTGLNNDYVQLSYRSLKLRYLLTNRRDCATLTSKKDRACSRAGLSSFHSFSFLMRRGLSPGPGAESSVLFDSCHINGNSQGLALQVGGIAAGFLSGKGDDEF